MIKGILKFMSILWIIDIIPTVIFCGVWVEESYSDFVDGSAIGGLGANLYVSIDGKVRMVGNDWDIDDNGWLDIVLTNEHDASGNHYVPTQIFWGNPNGFDSCTYLSTFGAEAAAIADLNIDGYPELIVTNNGVDVTYEWSYIYWGSSNGYSDSNYDSLFTYYPHGAVTPADLNKDGYLDLVFSSWGSNNSWSLIYYGGPNGYSMEHMDSLPTYSGHGNWIADLDKDGWLDIIFANYFKGTTTYIYSYIYWGGQSGFHPNERDSLPTVGAGDDISVADLNNDGYLDIVFPNHSTEPAHHSRYLYSYIYYGDSTGYSKENSVWLPTVASWSSSVADLNNDGWLDIVFSNFPYEQELFCYSYIYWGGQYGYSIGKKDSLYTQGGSAVMIADFNNDGYKDIVFGNQRYASDTISYSYIYWNSDTGFSITNRDSFLTNDVDASVTKDLGNIYTRDSTETYFSSIFDALSKVSWGMISWKVDTIWKGEMPFPDGITVGLDLWIRTGNTPNPDTGWSDWIKMDNQSIISPELANRYIQYKTNFYTNYKASLALDRVSIEYFVPEKEETETFVRSIIKSFPNPFTNTVTLSYLIKKDLSVSPVIKIYDMSGKIIKTFTCSKNSGSYTIVWDGSDNNGKYMPSGTYFCAIETSGIKKMSKIVFIRK
jgi:hypothetical protein